MTKGRPATTGIDDAVAIARKRGCVMRILYGFESICDLVIRTAAYVAFVKARRTNKITATIHEIGHVYRDLIAELRLFPESAQIVPELWVYSKHGTYRFFRIGGDGLLEIDQNGIPAGEPATTTAPESQEAPAANAGEGRHACPKGTDKTPPPGEYLRREQGAGDT